MIQPDNVWKWNKQPPTPLNQSRHTNSSSPVALGILTLSGCELAYKKPLPKSDFDMDNNTIVQESQEPVLDTLGLTPAMGIQQFQENDNLDLEGVPFCSFPNAHDNAHDKLSQENMSQDLMYLFNQFELTRIRNPSNSDQIMAIKEVQTVKTSEDKSYEMQYNLQSTLEIQNHSNDVARKDDKCIPDSLVEKENQGNDNRTKLLFKRMGHPILVEWPSKDPSTTLSMVQPMESHQTNEHILKKNTKVGVSNSVIVLSTDPDENPDIVQDSEEEKEREEKIVSEDGQDSPIKVSKQKRKLVESPIQSQTQSIEPERDANINSNPKLRETSIHLCHSCQQSECKECSIPPLKSSKKKICLTKIKKKNSDKRNKKSKQRKMKDKDEVSSTEPEDSQDQDYVPSKPIITPSKSVDTLSLQKGSSSSASKNTSFHRSKQKKLSFQNWKPYTPCWVLDESGIMFPAMFLEETVQGIKVCFSAGEFYLLKYS